MRNTDDNEWSGNRELESLRGHNPFGVPPAYFQSLPDRIARRIAAEPPARVVPLKRSWSMAYAAAACVAVLALAGSVGLSLLRPGTASQRTLTYEEVTSSTAFFDLDESLLVDALANQPGSATGTESAETRAIEDYLIDNAADISGYYIENL
jgi:hypothetical protein